MVTHTHTEGTYTSTTRRGTENPEQDRVKHRTPTKGFRGRHAILHLPLSGGIIHPMPGFTGASWATGYIKVTDVPDLSAFTQVNPRAPKPAGAVPKAILYTLTHTPSQMALKNAGLYLLVGKIHKDGDKLTVELKDPDKHGLVNGGHTYAMIREVMENGTPEQKGALERAYVPLHVFSGIPDDLIVEMASGLNHTRQVQAASLEHLRGHYDTIKRVMDQVRGGDQIAYFEGDAGSIPIGDILAYVEMFNLERYPLTENPYGLYAHRARVIEEASEDFSLRNAAIGMVISKLPDILSLSDLIRKVISPLRSNVEIVRSTRAKRTPEPSEDTGGKPPKVLLPFLGERVHDRLPNGWLYPILAAFRANVVWDLKTKKFGWKKPNLAVLEAAAPELVAICYQEQRNSAGKPEWVGKRESAYRQCKMHIDLTIQKLRS